MPNCSFFGVEAGGPAVSGTYGKEVGTVIPYPVAGETGMVDISVYTKGKLASDTVIALTLLKLTPMPN